ncbi:MAG: VOC family protein [Firmicutes bacterium]|nr:VOC family protein [Alicyclobacillaceae bacterium]MCL6497127.1 VOC family protein [Bacillota bacterium]
MGILRLGYVHVRAQDLERTRDYYENTLGLSLVRREPGRLFFKGWDEWDHHHLVLEPGGAGIVKFGLKVASPEDLERFEAGLERFGLAPRRMSAGETYAVGEGVRVVLPSGHTMELYHDIEFLGTAVGTLNPPPRPRHWPGVGVSRLDHALLTAEDPALIERLFTEVLGFHVSHRLVTDVGPKGRLVATWLFVTHKSHDLAFIQGQPGKLHHFAYRLLDWDAVRRAGEILSMDDVPVVFGPDVHGLTRGQTIYCLDPAGNRNELFAGDVETAADFPTITWTTDQIRHASYIARFLREHHFSSVT